MRDPAIAVLEKIMKAIDALSYGSEAAHAELRSFWTTGSTRALINLKNSLGVLDGLREIVRETFSDPGLELEERFRLEMDVYDIWSDTFDKIPFDYRTRTLQVLVQIMEPKQEESPVISIFGRQPSQRQKDDDRKARAEHNARIIRDYRLKG